MSDVVEGPEPGGSPPTPPKPAPAAKPAGRRRWLPWTVGGILALGALVAAAPFLISTGWMNDRVRGWLRENVDREVEFESLDVSWTQGVLIRGLVVHDELAGRPPFLEAPTVVLRAPLLPMLVQRFDVSEFVIDDAVVHVPSPGDASRTRGIVKRKKGRRGADAPDSAEDDEPLVLPDIDTPVSIRNLTLVFTDAQGREARRGGIAFQGQLSTRAGPTTWDLDIPAGTGGNVHLKGAATLFGPDGAVLAMDAMRGSADVDVTGVDAQANADVLRVFMPNRPVTGVVDAKIRAVYEGASANGSIEMHVRGVAIDGAVGKRAGGTDDLTVTGRFDVAGSRISVQGLKVRADGLSADADLAGAWPNFEGRIGLDADLGRMTTALAAMGAGADTMLAGTAKGEITFSAASEGRGRVALTGLRVESRAGKHPPVAVDRAAITFAGRPEGDAFRLDPFDVQLADVTAHAAGTIGKDGTLDLETTAKGDLGGLLARGRDLGFLPSGFSVNGTLDAAIDVKGRAGATGADALGATIGRLVLTEDDARIEVKGTATAESLDLTASGAGDLGKLLGRAQAAGVKGPGIDAVSGRFAFDASAKGPIGALVVKVPQFRLDGDFAVDASGEMRPDGGVDAKLHAEGKVDDALVLARKLGFLDRELKLGGTLRADCEAAGTRSEIALPKFVVTLTDGPVTADVRGTMSAGGKLAGSVNADAALADLCRVAQVAGLLDRTLTPAGRIVLRGGFSGTREQVVVPAADVRLSGLADLTASGSMDASGFVTMKASLSGALQPLFDVAAQWTGGTARRLDGTISGSVAAEGPRDRLAVAVPNLSVVAGGISADASGARAADGGATMTVTARGPVADLVAMLRAFDMAQDVTAAGVLDATVDAKLTGRRVTGSAVGAVLDLVVDQPQIGGASFREARAAFTATGISYDLDTRKLEPVQTHTEAEGATIDATVDMQTGPAQPDGAPTTRIVRAEGTLLLEDAFARNHAELFSGVRFDRAEGPFRFTGDVSQGRAAAKGWTGGAELDVAGLVAPYVKAGEAHATAKLADGVIVLDPIEGMVNGGPVTGTARIGLVGERPEHSVDLTGRDVAIGGDLAPLVAHASPLFAVGEHGTTGGKAGIDVHLKARGLNAAAIRKSLTGGGTLGLTDAYVASDDWIGTLLSFIGSSGRMDIAPVEVPFDVRDGQVRTGELAMDGVGLLLRLGGTVGLDGKLDYGLRLRPKESSSAFTKFKSFLDKDGFLPLRLEGKLSKPKLRAPDLKDVLVDKLGDLLGDVLDRGRKDEDAKDDAPADEEKPGGAKKKKRDPQKPAAEKPPPADEPPPPPLPPRGKKKQDPVPPPAKEEEEPPPPPSSEEPPPPPPR